jgi:hypothetical protein
LVDRRAIYLLALVVIAAPAIWLPIARSRSGANRVTWACVVGISARDACQPRKTAGFANAREPLVGHLEIARDRKRFADRLRRAQTPQWRARPAGDMRLAQDRDNAARAFEKFQAGDGRVRPAVGALEQGRAEAMLNVLKPSAKGRLPYLGRSGGLP